MLGHISLSNDILPYIDEISVSGDVNLSASLDWYDFLFTDEFENLENWEVTLGDWNIDNGNLKSQYNLTYPNFIPTGPMQIDSNQEIYSDIDELISRHEEYVSQLLNGCFLSDRGKNKEISLQLEHILEVVQNFTQLHESIFQSLLEKVDFDVEDTEEMLDEITKQFRDYLSDFQNLADIGKGYCFEIDSRFEDRLEL